MGAINGWNSSRQMYILLGTPTDLRERFSDHFVQVSKPSGVKTLVRCGNPGDPAESQGQLAGVKSE